MWRTMSFSDVICVARMSIESVRGVDVRREETVMRYGVIVIALFSACYSRSARRLQLY